MKPTYSRKLPLGFQIAQLLRARIRNGEYGAEGRIAPELQLAQELGVSVITVQKALREIEADGLITRKRGRGTFVRGDRPAVVRPQQSDALSLMFSDEFGSDTEILQRQLIETPASLEPLFGTGKLLHIQRLVRRRDVTWSLASIYVLPEFSRPLTPALLRRYPMFRLLREKLGVPLGRVTLDLQARPASQEQSTLLQIDGLEPVSVLSAVVYDAAGRPINALEIAYRADQFVFRLDLDMRTGSLGELAAEPAEDRF